MTTYVRDITGRVVPLPVGGGGGGGVTDHGALTGLGDDDHTQYFNTARLATYTGFDGRYYTETEIDAILDAITGTPFFDCGLITAAPTSTFDGGTLV